MTLGAGIFLSAIFLGCVFLYIKSDNKLRWRNVAFWSSLIFLSGTVIFFIYLIYNKEIEKTITSIVSSDGDSYTQIKGIKLGESLSDLQFHHGEFKKNREKVNDFESYKSDSGVVIEVKNDKAEALWYNCREYFYSPVDDPTRLAKIKCGDSGELILKTFDKKNVDIRCNRLIPEWRSYELTKHKIVFVLEKNIVVALKVYLGDFHKSIPSNC